MDRDVRSLLVTGQGSLPTDFRPSGRRRSHDCLTHYFILILKNELIAPTAFFYFSTQFNLF